jgi:hypothetical protein
LKKPPNPGTSSLIPRPKKPKNKTLSVSEPVLSIQYGPSDKERKDSIVGKIMDHIKTGILSEDAGVTPVNNNDGPIR